MQFLVIGVGRFGRAVAETLAQEGHEVVAVDRDEDKLLPVADLVSDALVMDSTQERALRTLGVEDFDAVIVAVGEDVEASVLTTVLLKDLGARRVVVKASSELHAKILRRVGADLVVFPEREMGERVARTLASPRIWDYIELSKDYSLVEIVAPKEFEGKSIRDTQARSRYGIHIIAIKRRLPRMDQRGEIVGYEEEVLVAPPPDTEIMPGDLLVVIGKVDDVERFRRLK